MKSKIAAALFLNFISISVTIAQSSVTIGTQVWMSKNLDVSTFRNGDPIPEAQSLAEWIRAVYNKTPAWCYGEDNGKYGKLYNWYAVSDSRGLAPNGWHVPKDTEWTTLIDFLGGNKRAGPILKSEFGWGDAYGGVSGNGNNAFGFTALPSGIRGDDGVIYHGSYSAIWWTSTASKESQQDCGVLADDTTAISLAITKDREIYLWPDCTTAEKGNGCAVRCIRD